MQKNGFLTTRLNYMCLNVRLLSSVRVTECSVFLEIAAAQFTISQIVFIIFHFGFEDRNLILVVPVTGHCLPFYFY